MKFGKAVEEVWSWGDSFEKELEKIPENERIEYINKKAQDGCRRLGINCRIVRKPSAPQKHKAA